MGLGMVIGFGMVTGLEVVMDLRTVMDLGMASGGTVAHERAKQTGMDV